jgi:hypothetical protein
VLQAVAQQIRRANGHFELFSSLLRAMAINNEGKFEHLRAQKTLPIMQLTGRVLFCAERGQPQQSAAAKPRYTAAEELCYSKICAGIDYP